MDVPILTKEEIGKVIPIMENLDIQLTVADDMADIRKMINEMTKTTDMKTQDRVKSLSPDDFTTILTEDEIIEL